MDESNFMSPIVIKSQKHTEDIKVCVSILGLNVTCVPNFLILSTRKMLNKVVGKKAYSFIDGVLSYHRSIFLKNITRRPL